MSAGSAIICYDANGNMTQKIDGSTTSYAYDAENRMTAVSGAATATFVYDGDGNRVKGVVGGVTTTYIGNYFEWSGSTSTMKKYYYAGGARVAERKGTTLYWLLSDHQPLQGAPRGSTSITATSSGSKTAELRYKACPLRGCSAALREGETRYTYGTTQTTIRYTPSGKTTLRVQAGQREESSLGLYWYSSRWYSPYITQFTQPDSKIPDPYNPLDWNRYAYARSNPLKYTDPDGHFPWLVIPILIFIATIPGDTGPYEVNLATATVGDAALRFIDPIDWVYTGIDCLSGNCSGTDIFLGMLPFVNGGMDNAVDAARALDGAADQAGESIIRAINPPSYPGGLRRAMKRLGSNPPTGMLNPQVHHNLPWDFREWFAGPGRGLDVNDPQFGRWVSGSPQGSHQKWSYEYNQAWRSFIKEFPDASRQQVLAFLQNLLDSGRYPSQ